MKIISNKISKNPRGGGGRTQLTIYNSQLIIKISKYIILALCIVHCTLCIISCELFTTPADPDYIQKLKDEVRWANAARLYVTVAYPQAWGTSPNAGTNRCYDTVYTKETPRLGYEFTVEFTPSMVYSLTEWRAYKTSEMPEGWMVNPLLLDNIDKLDSEAVSVPAEISARGGSGTFTINIAEPVTLVPYCKTQPYIVRTIPVNSPGTIYPRGTEIVIYFNSPLALAPNEPLETMFQEGKISITADGESISENFDHYNRPVYTANNDILEYKITISPSDVPGGKVITVTAGPDIFNAAGEPMERAESFSFATAAGDVAGNITEWGASYNGSSITVTWIKDPQVDVIARYRVNQGGDNDLPSSRIIPNADLPGFSGIRQGNEITGIREYEIFLDLYIEGVKSNTGSKSFKIWNIATPGQTVSGIEPGSGMSVSITSETNNTIHADDQASLITAINSSAQNIVLTSDITLDNWTPVNMSNKTFYGNGKTITVNGFSSTGASAANIGLFGTLSGNAFIRDLTVKYNVDITSNADEDTNFGCIAGFMQDDTRIENVVVTGSAVISKNKDYALRAGGITGYFDSTTILIRNAYSNLNLAVRKSGANYSAAGGIFGDTFAGLHTTATARNIETISNVTVAGNIQHEQQEGEMYTGGIAGHSQIRNTTYNNYHDMEFTGNLTAVKTGTGNSYIGGVIGRTTGRIINTSGIIISYSSLKSSGSINIPNTFTSNGEVNIGGIIGNSSFSKIIDSNASGNITVNKIGTGELRIGGICGSGEQDSHYENCYHEKGDITVSSGAGNLLMGGAFGFIGNESIAKNCRSLTNLLRANKTSGIISIGGFAWQLGQIQMDYCYAKAEILAEGTIIRAGGLVGFWNSVEGNITIYIRECYAAGNVTVSSSGFTPSSGNNPNDYLAAGGLVGLVRGATNLIMIIEDSYALGNVRVNCIGGSNPVHAGGIIGSMSSYKDGLDLNRRYRIQNCFSTGTVYASSENSGTIYAGGIAGQMYVANDLLYPNVVSNSNIRNNAALGSSITAKGSGTRNVGRIFGTSAATNSNNYALSTMVIESAASTTTFAPEPNSITPNASGQHGANASASSFYNKSIWNPGLDFNEEFWDFIYLRDGYPLLKNTGGQ